MNTQTKLLRSQLEETYPHIKFCSEKGCNELAVYTTYKMFSNKTCPDLCRWVLVHVCEKHVPKNKEVKP